jgi:hypothetical protein
MHHKGRYHAQDEGFGAAQKLVVMRKPEIGPVGGVAIPALFAPNATTGKRVFEFFTANIRNRHTREAYARVAAEFSAWCEKRGIGHCAPVEPVGIILTDPVSQ